MSIIIPQKRARIIHNPFSPRHVVRVRLVCRPKASRGRPRLDVFAVFLSSLIAAQTRSEFWKRMASNRPTEADCCGFLCGEKRRTTQRETTRNSLPRRKEWRRKRRRRKTETHLEKRSGGSRSSGTDGRHWQEERYAESVRRRRRRRIFQFRQRRWWRWRWWWWSTFAYSKNDCC